MQDTLLQQRQDEVVETFNDVRPHFRYRSLCSPVAIDFIEYRFWAIFSRLWSTPFSFSQMFWKDFCILRSRADLWRYTKSPSRQF